MVPRIDAIAAVVLATGLLVPGAARAASAQNPPADPARYEYATVALPGWTNTAVADINDFGAYVGGACDMTCTKSVLFTVTPQGKRTLFSIQLPDFSANPVPVGIDDQGNVDGNYTDANLAAHGFLRSADGHTWTEINDPNAAEISGGGTAPQSISPDGSVIVGDYIDSSLLEHGFLDFLGRDGGFTTYDVPNASATVVNFYYGGEFGGYYISSDGAMHAFYVNDGKLHTVQAPGLPNPASGQGAALVAVSSNGTLFGDEFPQQPFFGFAYADGRYTTIKDPLEVGTTSLDGTEISNANLKGELTGHYSYTASGNFYGFIATPEP